MVNPHRIDRIFAIRGDSVVRWGTLPPLVPAAVEEELKSAGDR
jgi:hypothetical protein